MPALVQGIWVDHEADAPVTTYYRPTQWPPTDPETAAKLMSGYGQGRLPDVVAVIEGGRLANEWRLDRNYFADPADAVVPDESDAARQRRLNVEARTAEPEALCPRCGHALSRHDPEDGRCDAHRSDGGIGVCLCGRD